MQRTTIKTLLVMVVILLGSACLSRADAADGSIVAWPGDAYDAPLPNTGFVAIAAGWTHSLGLKVDGSIVAWGSNTAGQCNVPAPNADFVAVAVGAQHSLGLKADGTILQWGEGGPVYVHAGDYVAVAGGWYHGMGLRADGSIVAWGWNLHGQCNVPAPNAGFKAIAVGYGHSLGLKADGSIVAWGWDLWGQATPPAGNDFVAISAGGYCNLALKANGSIVGWGRDDDGETMPPAGNDFVAIAVYYFHSLALKADGSIVAWGACNWGGCDVPAPNTDFVAIAAGPDRGLVLETTLDRGVITAVRGNVTLDSFKAKLLDRVRRLSEVETGGDGYVRIRHPSGTEIDLAPNSRMQVDGSISKTNLELFKGKLREKVGILSSKGELKVITPQIVSSVRGTELVVETTANESLTIVLDGEVDVSTPNGSQHVLLGQNQGVIATNAGLGAPFGVDPGQIDRWWEWADQRGFYADFDLEYICETALRATNFDASNQELTPSWRLELDNPAGPGDPNWQIDSLTFHTPYELFNLDPEPDILENGDYIWTDLTITPGEELEIVAEQNTYSESIYFPYTITREFSGNLISGEGDFTTTVTVTPGKGITGFDVEISVYAAESEQAWHEGDFFGTLSSVSYSMSGGDASDFEHEDTPICQEYEWEWDSYVLGEPLTFTVTIHVDLEDGIDSALIEPRVIVSGRMDAGSGSENWVDNTLQLPNEGGTITIDSDGQVSDSDSHIPWIGVYMPQYVASSKFDNTPEGDDIVVTPIDATTGTMPVTVIFDEVTEPGVTSLTGGSSGPPPASGFMLGDPPTYYELSTTAELPEGSQITVCIDYTGISFVDESKLKLYHYEDTDNDGIADDWVDCTDYVDTENKIICGTVTSFSTFAIFETVNQPPVMVQEALDIVNGFAPEVFKKPKDQKKITKELNSVIDKLEKGKAKDQEKALKKLEKLIKKMDGCALKGYPDKKDSIIDCDAQAVIYPLLLDVIELLKQ